MKRFSALLISVFCCCSFVLASPQKKIDSLRHVLVGQKDSVRVLTLVKLSQAYFSVNEDSAFYFGQQLKTAAEESGNPKRICDAYVILGSCFYHLNKQDSAFFYKRKAVDVAKKNDYQKGIANGYNDLGLYKQDDGEMDSAVYFFIQTAQIREKANDIKPLGACYLNLGLVFYNQKDYSRAMFYYNKASVIFQQFREMKNYSRALNLIGALYDGNQKYDSALIIYKRSFSIRDSLNDSYGISESEINIAVAYRNLGDLKTAEDYLLKSLIIKRELQEVGGEADCLLDLSETYRLEKKYDLAEKTLLRCDSLTKVGGTKELQRDVYQEFASLYAAMNNFEKAFYYQGKYQELKDSIFDEEKIKVLDDMQTKYETDKKEKENSQLKEQAAVRELALERDQNQKIFLYAGIGILVLILSIAFYAYRTKQKSNELLTEKNAQINKHNSTLKQLNLKLIESEEELTDLNKTKDKLFSVISHDISNPVKAIANYNQAILSNEKELSKEELTDALKKINQSVQPLQGFIDNLLHWSLLQRNGAKIMLEKFKPFEIADEIKTLYGAYALQKKIVIQNNIHASFEITTDKNMFRLVMRNLASNAIKFSNPNGVVKMNCSVTAEKTIFSIVDNGQGMDLEKIKNILAGKTVTSEKGTLSETGTGLGLGLVVEYLRLNNSDLKISSEVGKGSVFSFEIQSV